MSRLKELIKEAKCSVSITANNHRDYYETIEQYIKPEESEDISNDIWLKMIELDTCIELQVYPNTPIGSFTIYHYDVDKAIEKALSDD